MTQSSQAAHAEWDDVLSDVQYLMATVRTRLSTDDQSAKQELPTGHPSKITPPQSPLPIAPLTIAEAGLPLGQLSDLILKLLYLHGSLSGFETAAHLRLPFRLIDQGISFLRAQKCVEILSADIAGRLSFRGVLTDHGRIRAREAFEVSRYVGPAPVPLSDYAQQCRRQSVSGIPITPAALRHSLQHLVLTRGLIEEIGPALADGRSLLLYGPPGNGKSAIAKGIAACLTACGGEIYVPYAISVENSIITVFDPSLHNTTDDAELSQSEQTLTLNQGTLTPDARESAHGFDNSALLPDRRWRRVRRPVVLTAGELTLDMLDLRHHPEGNYYTAPLHVKANGGIFVIDDFGRQRVPLRQLLNRWILPLEERTDHLTLSTGKKFPIPFEQFVVFSSNLSPQEWKDEAFLRRIRHKVPISGPSPAQFREILRRACLKLNLEWNAESAEKILERQYHRKRLPRACDPQDLLQLILAYSRFLDQTPELSGPLLHEALRRLE